ncbi:MAG: hypothetical protein KAQ89_02215 [Planctomycetes bacterium]|nr:hypothetical protein [Planctomycetota bacterium]
MKKLKSEKKSKPKRKPYSEAKSDERVERNWKKTHGLFTRGEYSVAVIRCGTCIELSVNFAVRQELVVKRELPLSFVDKLLKNANGLRNKYLNIFLPIMAEHEKYYKLTKLWKNNIIAINKQRNAIVHSGEFRSNSAALKVMKKTYEALETIISFYEHNSEFKRI